MRTQQEKIATLKTWLKRRSEAGRVVTADELIDRIKKNWPGTSDAQIDELYQLVGHL